MIKISFFLIFLLDAYIVNSVSIIRHLDGYLLSLESLGQTGMENTEDSKMEKHFCSWSGKRITPRAMELKCCNMTYMEFSKHWYNSRHQLTELLETLKVWECPQFQQECANPIFNFTDFSKLVYVRACDREAFIEQCYDSVKDFAFKQNRENSNVLENKSTKNVQNTSDFEPNKLIHWKEVIDKLKHGTITFPVSPCVQVALHDKGERFGHYKEMVRALLPFCHITWCGVDAKSVEENYISMWACMETRCKAGVIFSITLTSFLSLLILFSSGTVIVVFCRNGHLRNSQGIYKISLSIADFIIGGVVLPSFVINITRSVFGRETLGDPHPQADPEFKLDFESNYDITSNPMYSSKMMTQNVISSHNQTDNHPLKGWKTKSILDDILSDEFSQPIGFFTTLALVASVYSLMIASFDRLSVVRYPLKYNSSKAKKEAIWAAVCLWIVSAVFAGLPFFVNELRYELVASVLICLSGRIALYVYVVVFLIPILLMWTSTVATCCYSYKNARQRSAQDFTIEFRLTRTLIIMVVVFTLSLLPAVGAIVSSLFLTDIFVDYPKTLNTTAGVNYISFEFMAVVVLVCNSSWNFAIYNARNDSFKKATKSLFTFVPRSVLLSSDI